VSNAIRYDALLVRDLAAELHAALAGSRLATVCLDRPTLRIGLAFRAARRTDTAPAPLLWNLHPESGALHRLEQLPALGGRVQLATPSIVLSVSAPADERILIIDLDVAADAPDGAARRLVVELVTNQWNALALSLNDRIIGVLRERRTRERELRAGVAYQSPTRSGRAGRDGPLERAEWLRLLSGEPPGTRLSALVHAVAFTSPINAPAILGDADVSEDAAALQRAYDRYVGLIWSDTPTPVVLRSDARLQPYSRALDAVASPAGSLLDAFEAAATESAPDTALLADRVLDAIARRIESAQRRMERLRLQQDGATADAERLRSEADLLLAQLHRVPHGAGSVDLDDFAGGTVRLQLDPTLTAADNATRRYDAARKRSRAAARIPQLLSAARRDVDELEALAQRVRDGEVDEETLQRLKPAARSSARDAGPALPYREYRTSRGIEIRVGRGSRANDALTFRHSSPTDIWLHARDAAGAHVILRWANADANPPAADIAEAATLAALFSRARTSGLVAVDWTRRKWVRKARKAAPGLVIPERVKTVFVEPDAELEERLRAEPVL
jgi:hypothetical protein